MSDDATSRLRDMLADMPGEDSFLADRGYTVVKRPDSSSTPTAWPRADTGRARYQHADRLSMLFMRYPTVHVIRQIIQYADAHGRPSFAEGTYRKVLSGDNVFAEAVNVVEDFHEHVENNLRDYYLPKPPLPVTREEACEYVRKRQNTMVLRTAIYSQVTFDVSSIFLRACFGVRNVCQRNR
jgi:hypothetical protein